MRPSSDQRGRGFTSRLFLARFPEFPKFRLFLSAEPSNGRAIGRSMQLCMQLCAGTSTFDVEAALRTSVLAFQCPLRPRAHHLGFFASGDSRSIESEVCCASAGNRRGIRGAGRAPCWFCPPRCSAVISAELVATLRWDPAQS